MKYLDWLNKANEIINETLVACLKNHHLGGWSENHITTQVMKSIEGLGLEIDWSDKPQKVKWQGFKLKGKQETSLGDIAVIVKIWITNDRFVEGVSFYEAKRQYFDNNWRPKGFSSIELDQLANIGSKTHASNILLYDVDIDTNRAYASSVPTTFVEELAKAKVASSPGRSLHKYGDFWVKSLGNNLLGMHLDYKKESVDEIKKLAASSNKPLIILNAAVAKTKKFELELDSSFIDRSFYDEWPEPEPEPELIVQPSSRGPKWP